MSFGGFSMRFNKKGTRLLSMLMAIAMCLVLSLNVFAAEVTSTEEGTAAITANGAVAPLYWHGPGNNQLIDYGGTPLTKGDPYTTYICPPKGATLKFVGNNAIRPNETSVIKIETTKQGGWWPSNTTTLPKGQGAKTDTLISNCDGKVYKVVFSAADKGYFAGTLYWTTG